MKRQTQTKKFDLNKSFNLKLTQEEVMYIRKLLYIVKYNIPMHEVYGKLIEKVLKKTTDIAKDYELNG